jgi:hypothetical protein
MFLISCTSSLPQQPRASNKAQDFGRGDVKVVTWLQKVCHIPDDNNATIVLTFFRSVRLETIEEPLFALDKGKVAPVLN